MSGFPCLCVKVNNDPLSPQFLIEYDSARNMLLIDRVEVSVELLHTFVVDPPDRWLKFRRTGDLVTVEQAEQMPKGTTK